MRCCPSGAGLERLKATGQNGFSTRDGKGRTEAGPGATTRRVVAPKPGLVGQESGGSEVRMDAEGYQVTLKLPEGFEIQTLQPVSF